MDKEKYTLKEIKTNVRDYISYLKKEHHLPIEKVYLFGSYAKNNPRNYSDVDVCVVSSKFKKMDAISYLWHTLRRKDIENLLEPVGLSPEDFRKGETPLVWEIRKSGKEIRV